MVLSRSLVQIHEFLMYFVLLTSTSRPISLLAIKINCVFFWIFRFLSHKLTSRLQTKTSCTQFQTLLWSWKFPQHHSLEWRLKSHCDKSISLLETAPMWTVTLPEKCLPVWALRYVSSNHNVINLTISQEYKLSENSVQYIPHAS